MIKFSASWLKEWLNYNKDIHSLSKIITILGFEIEKIEYIKNNINFDNILVGEIVKYYVYQKNPKIYKLIILINNGRFLKIFSNINNLKNKTKVILATKDSSLYKKYIKIPEYSFLLKSEGLLCSNKIINSYKKKILKNDIIKLPYNSYNGENANQYLKKITDNILHINIPTNRPDCLSILGLTRDLSVLNNVFFLQKPYNNILLKKSKKYNININFNKNINDILYQYNYCIVKNIDLTKEIPLFIKNRLFQSGIKISIENPLLNIYNYIILELGYPIQFYDFNKITGDIYIKSKKKNQNNILNFENKNINLINNNSLLIIKDKSKIISIPGIIQNKDVIIQLTTKNILIECFFINKKYFEYLFNENSYFNNNSNIYNRFLDPLIQKEVIIRTVNLIIEIFGGDRSKIYSINMNSINYIQKIIKLSFKNIYKILGFHILKKNIINILNKLNFLIIKKTINYFIIKIPSWRNDINIEEDIIEEIIRIYGYNKIPNKIEICLIKKNILKKQNLKLKNTKINFKKIKNILIHKGYHEVINYSFINPKIQSILYPKIEEIKIQNPLTNETSVMRCSLICGLINNIIYNQNRQQKNLRFFEYGLCFFKNLKKKIGISQKLILSGITNGNLYSDYWGEKNKLINFYDIKGDIEYFFDFLKKNNKIEFRQQKNITILHPYISSLIYFNNIYIGYIGMLHPKFTNYFNINYDTFLFEIFFDKIIVNNILNLQKIINLPVNKRDISFSIKKNIYFIDILSFLKKLKLKDIIKIKLIDIYQGNNIPVGYKNITLSIFIQNKYHTLTEQEINSIIKQCIFELKKKFQILFKDYIDNHQ
ncbi:phenylalanine--tRNA ligase subunit beta [Enterobacteriaceae endosymbiont of Donacia thalassina]|uniref:phenylalanine--tRNA ligase subunit beta n=1 Tax=Enterobacteriaceae endosymbiont of Donacia thalassina TaxID=2675786 RepID=UPI001448B8B3|nr:phenylalanine--tRNA ligase subunit beta [Enterobacteriaceae endosymbiont of Donacia thalassina]QJC37227.1 phenylalanine--tRNA ligase subunit beta [Enterobacteriaceae endosymbiont of Donacia thalassina]